MLTENSASSLLDNGTLGIDLSMLTQKRGTNEKILTPPTSIPAEDSIDFTTPNAPQDDEPDNKENPSNKTVLAEKEKLAEEKRIADEAQIAEEAKAEEKRIADEAAKEGEKINPYRVFADLLKDRGVIEAIPETFEESGDGLTGLIEGELEARKQSWIDGLPPTAKYFIESYEEGVPLNSLLKKEAAIQAYESINPDTLEEDAPMQKSIVRDYHAKNGWSNAEIQEEIDENEQSGKLGKKAKQYLAKLIQGEKKERADLIRKSQEEKREMDDIYSARIDKIRTTIKEMNEVFPGIKFTDTDKKTVFNGITRFDKDGKNEIAKFREKNPKFDFITTYLALVLKGDLSRLNKVAATKAVNNIKEKIDAPIVDDTFKGVDFSVIKNVLKDSVF